MYRNVDVNAVRAQPYAILVPPDHGFQLKAYYIRPEYQLDQLRDAGFDTISVYDQFGREVDPRKTEEPGYFYFLCKPIQRKGPQLGLFVSYCFGDTPEN